MISIDKMTILVKINKHNKATAPDIFNPKVQKSAYYCVDTDD